MHRNLILLCIITFAIFSSILHAEEKLPDYLEEITQNVREPAVAGRFYNGTEPELKKQVNNLLRNAFSETIPGKPIALI